MPPTAAIGIGGGDVLKTKEPVAVHVEEIDDLAVKIPKAAAESAGKNDNDGRPKFVLENHSVDEIRKLKVCVIGAGIGGINAAILLPAKVPGIELTVLEKNDEVSGTWLENVYPGVRCDIPAHVYQSTFSPNTQWTQEFAEGHEISAYWKSVAAKYSVYKYLRLRQLVQRAEWKAENSKWVVTVLDIPSGTITEEAYDILIPAIGHFNAWKLPDIPGINDFQGHLRHSSNWDKSYNPTGKRVAVIGNGASGLQVVPNLQRIVSHLDHYARNPTWIASSFGGDERTFGPQYYSPEQLESFKDPAKYLEFRKGMENKYWFNFKSQFKNSDANIKAREEFTKVMKERLAKKPELLEQIRPDFAPHCRRLTPGPGYLEALCEDNVDFIRTPIKRFTEHGIETQDGKVREVDAIICCTGANIDGAPPFPIIANDINLASAWKHDGIYGFPYTYVGVGVPSFPNLLFLHGPFGAGPSGTIPHSIETQLTYHAKVLRKISSQGIATMTPSKAAADDFVEYCDAYFPTTVLSENCSSWSNGGRPGKRIHGHWPGSAAHLTFVRREPRWEDFEYTYVGGKRNRFGWLGNGWTEREKRDGGDMTGYLREGEVDLRTVHEGQWWID